MSKVLSKLSQKTNIHGFEHAGDSSSHFWQFFWLAVFLVCTGLAAYQIAALTRTFLAEETVASNHFVGTLTSEQFLQRFKPVYCAQDWLDVPKIHRLNANPLALIAASAAIGPIDFYAFNTLLSMLSTTQTPLATGVKEGRMQDWTSYYVPTKIRFRQTKTYFENLLNFEFRKQNVSTELELLTKFTNQFFKDSKFEPRLGGICQTVVLDNGSKSSVTFYKTQFILVAEHFFATQRIPPKFQILLQPDIAESTNDFYHPYLDTQQYVAENNYHYVMKEETQFNSAARDHHLVYSLVIDGKYHRRIVTKSSQCIHYPFMTQEVSRLSGICKIGCDINRSTNVTDFEVLKMLFKQTLKVLIDDSYVFTPMPTRLPNVTALASNVSESISAGPNVVTQYRSYDDCILHCTRLTAPCEESDVKMRSNGIVEMKYEDQQDYDYDYFEFSDVDKNAEIISNQSESNDEISDYEHNGTIQFDSINSKGDSENMLSQNRNIADDETRESYMWSGQICNDRPNVTGLNMTLICRKRTVAINIHQYVIIEEKLLMTFDDYIGAVGGSLGVFMGASVISLIQFCLNFISLFKTNPFQSKPISKSKDQDQALVNNREAGKVDKVISEEELETLENFDCNV